ALQDRLIVDSIGARLQVARLVRRYRPHIVFTTAGAGVHPDHKAVTDIVTHGVFYSRLPKWDEVPGAEAFEGSEPHEIDRLFFWTLPYGARVGSIRFRGGCHECIRREDGCHSRL